MSVEAIGSNGWRLRTTTGQGWNSPPRLIIAVDPKCPPSSHATRWCLCRAFKRREQAIEHIRQHDDSVT